MAHHAVAHYQVSIRLSCKTFSISETCYRYQAKLSDENAEIADWLLRLSDTHKRWGFGLCFLYLRNIKGYGWNHKRVYRIYRELELNLRIKPRRRPLNRQSGPFCLSRAIPARLAGTRTDPTAHPREKRFWQKRPNRQYLL